jgi:serine protease Do
MTRFAAALAGFTAVVGFLLGLVVVGTPERPARGPNGLRPPASPPLTVSAISGPAVAAAAGPVDFSAVAASVNAAVVNVDAAVRGDGRARSGPRWRRDIADDPGAPREGSGSGFLISPEGFLLTNFHVVDGADRLTVTLVDGRVFRAEVVGVDPAIDVALLKIPKAERLPVVTLGDSSSLRPGQWVCAIGNPLGYVHSVTVGVVSFLGRKLFDPSLDAYIQTDAAISLGNSGGPLIDAQGRVVGITTAVSAQAANIGFAVPIGQVIPILPQLHERGRVSRGFLGIGLTTLTPALQRALEVGAARGALVQDVNADTPAARSGLRTYDLIVSADDFAIQSDEDLIRYIAGLVPGTTTTLGILRDGAQRAVTVKLTERPLPEGTRQRSEASDDARPAAAREHGPLGLRVRELDRATAMRQGIPDNLLGVVVTDVDPAGPARLVRIRPGQLILEINRKPISSVAAFEAAIRSLRPGGVAAALLYDQLSDQRILVAISLDGGS